MEKQNLCIFAASILKRVGGGNSFHAQPKDNDVVNRIHAALVSADASATSHLLFVGHPTPHRATFVWWPNIVKKR